MIRAGSPQEITPDSGDWLVVDPGFSRDGKSCGVLGADGIAVAVNFSEASATLVSAGASGSRPLNVAIEAPLSVAFTSAGNPVGRSFERQGSQHRYWYEGLGCVVMTSTLYLLRALCDSRPAREIRLFEGFVSFKAKGARSSHCDDVQALLAVILDSGREAGAVIQPGQFVNDASHQVLSAFAVAGMDFGVPPVIKAMPNRRLQPTAAGAIMSRRG